MTSDTFIRKRLVLSETDFELMWNLAGFPRRSGKDECKAFLCSRIAPTPKPPFYFKSHVKEIKKECRRIVDELFRHVG